jgi:hypothetical protein
MSNKQRSEINFKEFWGRRYEKCAHNFNMETERKDIT